MSPTPDSDFLGVPPRAWDHPQGKYKEGHPHPPHLADFLWSLPASGLSPPFWDKISVPENK